jgi:hypothetical protein
VRELVLRAAVERQRVAEKETHRLAAAGDRDVQRAVRVGGELADQGGDAVGGAAVVFRRADVVERPAAGVFEDVDGGGGEIDRRQRVVPAEAVEPSRFFGEQGEAGLFGAAAGGDQVHLGGDERVRRRGNGERVEGLGDDLRRQAGDGDENAAETKGGIIRDIHVLHSLRRVSQAAVAQLIRWQLPTWPGYCSDFYADRHEPYAGNHHKQL